MLETIETAGWSDRVSISCFDLATCALVRSLDDRDIRWRGSCGTWRLGDALVQAHLLGFNAVNPHFSTVTTTSSTRARELELDVNVWTVNDRSGSRAMAALEVACIITDDPALAREVVTQSGPDGAPVRNGLD